LFQLHGEPRVQTSQHGTPSLLQCRSLLVFWHTLLASQQPVQQTPPRHEPPTPLMAQPVPSGAGSVGTARPTLVNKR
jgi:hypothetical protein